MSKSNGMSTTLAIKPVINHIDKTIIVSEKFMNEASVPFTAEFKDLKKLRKALPDYEVITRSHRKPRTTEKTQNIKKFVPYDKMVAYINLLPEREELLKQFEAVKKIAATYPSNPASIVFKWFNNACPDYRKTPKIDKDGNLIATVNVVNFADFKKSIEEKEQAEAEPPQADPQNTEDTNELKKAV